ncbi:hypothetical protein IWZ01DRAFT_481953 [Phyllosticta capitalensis]
MAGQSRRGPPARREGTIGQGGWLVSKQSGMRAPAVGHVRQGSQDQGAVAKIWANPRCSALVVFSTSRNAAIVVRSVRSCADAASDQPLCRVGLEWPLVTVVVACIHSTYMLYAAGMYALQMNWMLFPRDQSQLGTRGLAR